ncbi:MAG: ATP-dependent zinc metalloprotease FtsH [Firmicutes bacterium]|nr:ATP-dependent zinc metalloprotease FtsH [Bacillota bacterium]
MNNRLWRHSGLWVITILIIIVVVTALTRPGEHVQEISWTQFKQLVQNNQVNGPVTASAGTAVYHITGTYSDDRGRHTFVVNAPGDNTTTSFLDQKNVNVTYKENSNNGIWITLLSWIIPMLLFGVLLFFMFNQSQGGGNRVMNFGRSRARMYNEEKKRVTFDDVAGADEEKTELIEIVQFLKDPRKFSALGARIPKGVLLVGPPGTGKTLLARAVAGEAGVPFFSISGSDFVEMFVGVGAARVRDLFDQAKKNAPCIIFIDEIDAVGRQRGAGLGGGHDEREQTLNQLLVEMDGFEGNEGIIVMAATNRPDILDPALLRPGRFDRRITVNRPDLKGREDILRVHARGKPLAPDVDLRTIAKLTPGFAGADLENVLNEAALLAARRNQRSISMHDIEEAIDRVIAGPEKRSKVMSPKEKRLVAYHESGHTLVGWYLSNADTVHKVTIIPRGQAGGYTISLPKEDRDILTENDLLERVAGLMGGRAAEQVALGEISTGASNDFEQATQIVRNMVTRWGMSKRLGPIVLGNPHQEVFLGRDLGNERNYSEEVAKEIDEEIRRILDAAYKRAMETLTEHRDQLDLLANTLIEKETLTEEEIQSLLTTGQLPPVTAEEPSKTAGSSSASESKEKGTEHKREEEPRPKAIGWQTVIRSSEAVMPLRPPQDPPPTPESTE